MLEPFKQPGAFSWNELLTTDPAAAKKFYGELFGWTMEDMAVPNGAYTLIKVAGRAVGGIMAQPPQAKGAPPAWGAYVTVSDVDATAKRAQSLGARILVLPTDIPDVGRFCVLQDPQGAILSAITYMPMSE